MEAARPLELGRRATYMESNPKPHTPSSFLDKRNSMLYGDLAKALRLRLSLFEDHNIFIHVLFPCIGWGNMKLNNDMPTKYKYFIGISYPCIGYMLPLLMLIIDTIRSPIYWINTSWHTSRLKPLNLIYKILSKLNTTEGALIHLYECPEFSTHLRFNLGLIQSRNGTWLVGRETITYDWNYCTLR